MKKTLLTFLAATLLGGSAMASGYQVALQSNRSTAMANMGVGLRPDPSSIFFNPGALALMRQNGVQVGANLIYSNIAYQPFESAKVYRTENPTGTPFHVYAAFGPEDSNVKFGLGVYTPFGSSVQWEDNWAGRFSLTSLSLQAIYIQPTVSFALNENLSVGAGFIYAIGGVNLQRDIQDVYLGGQEYGSAELDGRASGMGFNVGVFFKPSEKFSAGINYRSRVDMKIDEGTATFRKSPLVPDEVIPSETSFTAELPLPSNLTLGISYQPLDRLTIGAEVMRAQWSAYKALTFNYGQEVGGESTTTAPRNYESAFVYRLGAEYGLNEMLNLRIGAYYDETPVQEGYLTAETPDANTLGLTAGFGVNINENFVVDASFLYINKAQRDNVPRSGLDNPLGTYKSTAFIPGLSLTYKF